MSDLLDLDLSNSANWNPIHSSSRTVTYLGTTGRYTALTDIDVTGGVLLDTPLVATYATSSKRGARWKTAGWLKQRVQTGITVGGQPDADAFDDLRVPLQRLALLIFPRYVHNFQLTFKTGYWFEQLDLNIWAYTGPVNDEILAQIELTRIDLLRVEAKVNALFNAP
ncbi:MAG TPA: hypothetical protein V6C95_23495 [Coleofasciculaceae cyanobacterium]